jgi:hypothetical protein
MPRARWIAAGQDGGGQDSGVWQRAALMLKSLVTERIRRQGQAMADLDPSGRFTLPHVPRFRDLLSFSSH